jgi:hypothetical protein
VRCARVDDPADAGPLGGVDDGRVLRDPLAQLVAGDQQDGVGPGERLVEGLRPVVVGLPDLDAQVGRLLGRPRAGHHLVGRQAFDDEPAQLSGGSRDNDHDCTLLWLVLSNS